MDKPLYQKKPIENVDSLAQLLTVDKNHLIHIANNAATFYCPQRKQKKDGSFREIYSVNDDLKDLQHQIVEKIYSNVHFPIYLQGSIKDLSAPRSHINAALSHTNALLLVNMDISNFFPSLRSAVIFDIWKQFFNFSEVVAELLTKLTTFSNLLPQGASTSSGLANLAFWDIESTVVDNLQRNGFIYTRFVDDVIVSSKSHTEMHELTPIIRSVYGMFRSKGVKPNRKKLNISTSGHSMLVHNLNINSGVPTMPKVERSQIRAAVKECERKYPAYNRSEDYEKLWSSTIGRVDYLGQFHPSEAYAYSERLQAIRPTTS